ncbi:MAG: hypothetical protein L6R42_001080 [Xanthoria sp. 1 TBL-2021]|nr:MAG: hypothetical protein L6R42_001080 [Xanthoria sp. 1 TBL-2021]
MGVQAYLTRLALGRSAHEPLPDGETGADSVRPTAPLTQQSNRQRDYAADFQSQPSSQGDDLYVQQYDNRGYPQNISSRALSRQSRRAQNDVLATVGILLSPDQFVQETPHAKGQSEPSSVQTQQDVEDVATESKLGYTLYNSYLALDIFSRSRMTCARHRIQTFPFYTGVPLHRILNTEWKVFGPLRFLTDGLSGDFLTFLMFDSQDMFYELSRCASEDYVVRLLSPTRSGLFQRLLGFGASTIKYCESNIAQTHRGENVLGLDVPPEGVLAKKAPTIRGQVDKDWTAFSNYFKTLTSWWESSIVRNQSSDATVSVPKNPHTSDEALVARALSVSANDGHEDHLAELSDDAEAAFSGNASDSPPSERSHRGAGPERNINQRASRSGSNEWQADVEGSELGITAPRSLYRTKDTSKPTYRVTPLTTLMADTLATSLSTIVADVILLPLEALLVRSVALTYLNTPSGAAYSTMGLRSEIYPLGSWAGMGLRGGRVMDYVRKMTLCLGVDMLLRFAVWQATAGAAWWVGKKKFKWKRQ